MSERISDINTTFVDGLCLNTRCDSNSICNHYSEDATSEQRDRFIVNPCIQCNSFLDNREKEDPVENSELEAY